jgi:gas vesicle protein GvpL/GvpF
MIWVYGICDRADMAPPRRRGLSQAPLDGVREGSLMAVITRHQRRVGEPAPDSLWAHERVVERLMADRTVLPMRFGSTVDGDEALRALLVSRRERFVALIERVKGCVELGVRVVELAADGNGGGYAVAPPPPTTGRDYLLTRLRDGRRAQRVAASLDEPLTALAAEVSLQPVRSPDEVLRAAYLVHRRDIPRFRARVERLQLAHPGVAILCTGPWPPYSFVAQVNGA